MAPTLMNVHFLEAKARATSYLALESSNKQPGESNYPGSNTPLESATSKSSKKKR